MAFEPFEILQTFDGGLNTKDFPENLRSNESPYLRNIDFRARTVRKASGYTLFGTDSSTDVGFFLYNHRVIVDSDEVLVKTTGTQLKFYDDITSTWHLLTSDTFTAGLRWWGASFNGYFYGCNGTDSFVRWRNSWSTLNGAVLAGATTIDLAAGTGARFANSGSGLIESDTFAWTGRTTDQLTGVTGLTSNHVDGSRVIVAADATTYTANPRGSIGAFFQNRIFTRDDTRPNFVYHTVLADNTNPQDDLANFTIAGSGAGDAGFFIFPADVLGLKLYVTGTNQPILVAACSDGILYSMAVTDTGGATVQTYTAIKVIGGDLVARNMMITTENDLVLVDSFNTIRSLSYDGQNTPLNSTRISDKIEPTMTEADFRDGYMEYFNRRIFIIGKTNDAAQNNYTIFKDTNPDAFGVYDHWQLNAIAEHNNAFYGISSLTSDVYRLFNGLNANGDVISSVYSTKQINFDVPMCLKVSDMMYISGFITSNCNIIVRIFFDEQGEAFSFTINGDNSGIVDGIGNTAIGTVVFGQGVFGGGLPDGVEKKRFFANLVFPARPYFQTMSIQIENTESDVDFELDSIKVFVEKSDDKLTYPQKILAQS
jgi:hypothetical protein